MTATGYTHHSYWLQRSAPQQRYESLRGHQESAVAIVGAGITGLSTAVELLDRGYTVAVYEAAVLGAGTTGASTGHLDCHPETSAKQLLNHLGAAQAKTYIQLRQQAIHLIQARSGPAVDLVRIPAIQYAEAAAAEEELRSEFEASETIGLEPRWLTKLPLPHMASGYQIEGQGRMNSLAYQHHLAALVTERGGRIYENTCVHSPVDDQPGVVQAGQGKAAFDHLVYAVHSNFTDSLRIDIQLSPQQTYVVVAEVAEDIPDCLMWDNANPYFYTRLTDSQSASRIMVGGCDHRTGMGDPVAAITQLEDYVRARFTVHSFVARWSAELFEPIDRLPLIGNIAGKDNVWIATGLSGIGLTQGTMAGWMIADLISGKTIPLQSALAATRFAATHLPQSLLEQSKAIPNYAERVLPSHPVNPADLKPGQGAVGRENGELIAVCRDETGEIHRCSAICQHMGGVVEWNAFEKTWDCPVHGGRYAAGGKRLYGPPESDLAEPEAPTSGK